METLRVDVTQFLDQIQVHNHHTKMAARSLMTQSRDADTTLQ